MSEPPISELVLQRAAGLPPGQRELPWMPRFADDPNRPVPDVAPVALSISVDGDVRRHLDADALASYETVDQVSDFHCVTTWTFRGLKWRGVRFRDVAADVVGAGLPEYVSARSADNSGAVFVTHDLLGPDVLLATHLDGEPLDMRHGAPLRLVSPGQYGYKNVKHLVELNFSADEPVSTYGNKEHLRARVDREERHRTLPNWLLRVPYRLAIRPTARAAERTLRKADQSEAATS